MVANHHISLNCTRGYAQRPAAFPISIILCGVRDVRDYRIQTSGKDIITGGSAFNIKTTSLRLGNFTRQEVVALWQLANRIYQEVIPRELIWSKQARITHQQYWYLTPERRLDMSRLLQAFLQRIVNGGGRIGREYGLGRKRTDLYIEWPVDEQASFYGEIQRIVLELKIRYGSLETTLETGLRQTADYAAQCGADEAHLLIFDRRTEVSWEDKIWHQAEHQDDQPITVWGL